jgi:hypothetical protein
VTDDFQNPKPALASLPAAPDLKFERADWTLFRTIEGLQQKAGVSKSRLRRLVLKELTDNGLDTGAATRVGTLLNGGGYFIEDDGPGIDPDEVARLFSINRPMVSTKLLRLPTRGALGNGLRVVAGAVLASQGSLTVITPQSPHHAPAGARRHHDRCQHRAGRALVRHPRRDILRPHPAVRCRYAVLGEGRPSGRVFRNGKTRKLNVDSRRDSFACGMG